MQPSAAELGFRVSIYEPTDPPSQCALRLKEPDEVMTPRPDPEAISTFLFESILPAWATKRKEGEYLPILIMLFFRVTQVAY